MAITRRQFLLGAPIAAAGVTAVAQSGANGWLRGIDVSKWQQTINWMSVKNAGNTFAFCKASEGTTHIDPYFSTNWPQMKNVGIVRGAYHFGRPGSNAIAQAEHFFETVKPRSGDLPLVLDLEAHDNKTPPQVWRWTQAFVNRLKALTGKPPLIYTGFYFWRDEVGNPLDNLGCKLWLPNYSDTGPTQPGLIPAAWITWTFWQYSSTGTVPGVTGNCDRNYFNGTRMQLNALTY